MLKSLMSGVSLSALACRMADGVDTSSLEPADVQEYRGYYKLVYGKDSILTHEQLVKLVMLSEDDMEPKDWAEAMLEAEGSDDDRSAGDDVVDETALLTSSAYEYASQWDDKFITDLEVNAKAALEGKRGAAVLMQDLVRMHGENVILDKWPVPETKQTGNENEQTHKYHKSVKDQATGETKVGNNNGDWYYDLFDASKPGREHQVRLMSWKGAKAGEKGKHILARHAAMAGSEIKLLAEKSKLDSERTNKKNAIVRSVKIIFWMHRLNTETDMKVELMTQDDGSPVESPKLFWCSDKKDHKKFVLKTIGQLLAFNIDKAKALGGSYDNVIGTTGRGRKVEAGTVTVPVIDKIDIFDQTTAEYSAFFEKLRTDTKAMNAFLTHLNGAGSDDTLLSLNSIMTDIDSYLSKPGIAKRVQALLTDERKTQNGKAA